VVAWLTYYHAEDGARKRTVSAGRSRVGGDDVSPPPPGAPAGRCDPTEAGERPGAGAREDGFIEPSLNLGLPLAGSP